MKKNNGFDWLLRTFFAGSTIYGCNKLNTTVQENKIIKAKENGNIILFYTHYDYDGAKNTRTLVLDSIGIKKNNEINYSVPWDINNFVSRSNPLYDFMIKDDRLIRMSEKRYQHYANLYNSAVFDSGDILMSSYIGFETPIPRISR